MRKLQFLLALLFIVSFDFAGAQSYSDSLKSVTIIATDKLGNCYAALQSEIIKLDQKGNKLFNFSRKDFGPVSQIDARDPLRVHLFYHDYGIIRILDNQMGETTTLDLRAVGLIDPIVIANAVDGGLWIYESVNNQLLKYDGRLQQQLLAINMFQFSGKPLLPVAMKASDNWLVLETKEEIYVFDRFGSYARTIALKSPSVLLRIDDQTLWYNEGDKIIKLQLRLNAEAKADIPFPQKIQMLEITPENYWLLTAEGLLKRFPALK